MTAPLPFGSRAIMNSRIEPPDSLEFFPTPPWATRALCEIVLGADVIGRSNGAWEPACGEGHMAETLREYFPVVLASDIHPYGYGDVQDFLLDHRRTSPALDWIITNPPYSLALDFAMRALEDEGRGLAMLMRTTWLEAETRWPFFSSTPPNFVWQFVERVPMHKGRYEPKGGTATAYAWCVWMPGAARHGADCRLRWIPPCKDQLFSPEDVNRWCPPAELPLFDGGEHAH